MDCHIEIGNNASDQDNINNKEENVTDRVHRQTLRLTMVPSQREHSARVRGHPASCARRTKKCPANIAAAKTFKIDHTPRVKWSGTIGLKTMATIKNNPSHTVKDFACR